MNKIQASKPRSRQLFDFNWLFHKGDLQGAEKQEFDAGNWQKLNLPHDFSIEGPFDENNPGKQATGYLPGGIGWYRKDFFVPEAILQNKVFIEFDGAFS